MKQFREETQLGMMVELSRAEASEIYGSRLAVAALGAIEKKKGMGEFRIIHDGYNSVLVNNRIRPRDQIRYPAIGDIQAVMHEISEEGWALSAPLRHLEGAQTHPGQAR